MIAIHKFRLLFVPPSNSFSIIRVAERYGSSHSGVGLDIE